MNLPNKLTIARMCAIPIVIVISLISPLKDVWEKVDLQLLILLVIFALASFTDFLDGKIARKYNLVTNFGKFMDPLADKLLVMATMIAMLELGIFEAFGVTLGFVITIILARELAITGLRTIAAGNNIVIAASKLGKAKTMSQMTMICAVIFINCVKFLDETWIGIITIVLVSIAAIMTIVSGIDYFIKNGKVLKEQN